MTPIEIFAALVVGHCLADYPLQGDFLARAKNQFVPIPGVPWIQAMSAHAIIHGGMVWAITGYLWLGLLEIVAHALIDHMKCKGALTFNGDQALHMLCKFFWVILIWWVS